MNSSKLEVLKWSNYRFRKEIVVEYPSSNIEIIFFGPNSLLSGVPNDRFWSYLDMTHLWKSPAKICLLGNFAKYQYICILLHFIILKKKILFLTFLYPTSWFNDNISKTDLCTAWSDKTNSTPISENINFYYSTIKTIKARKSWPATHRQQNYILKRFMSNRRLNMHNPMF